MLDMTEMNKLNEGLNAKGIAHTFKPLYDGMQIVICKPDVSAVCHGFSYGSKYGLIEIMGDIVENEYDTVEGWLTAEEILARL